jgi:RNA polymerase primary sigma factor
MVRRRERKDSKDTQSTIGCERLINDVFGERPRNIGPVLPMRESVREVIGTLNFRQMVVLILRYGLDGTGERTLREVGLVLNRTSENVRQHQERALRKLRHPSRSKLLRKYIEED